MIDVAIKELLLDFLKLFHVIFFLLLKYDAGRV
jgi:hypothetical protein